jgi:hypothetical protein
MNEHPLNGLRISLFALRKDITVAIPWETLHSWFAAAPLDLQHYAQINRHWALVWNEAGMNHPVPNVYMYHGAKKLTLVRETTPDDPPAVALNVFGFIEI